jgi:hypothetical protein
MVYITNFNLWRDLEPGGCTNNGTVCWGSDCHMCYSWPALGGRSSSPVCTGTGIPSGDVNIRGADWSNARLIAHELGHYLFCQDDEYENEEICGDDDCDNDGTPGEAMCAHSIMGNFRPSLNNFCTPVDHDKDDLGGSMGGVSTWRNAVDKGIVPISTPLSHASNWSWTDHDFEDQVGKVLVWN